MEISVSELCWTCIITLTDIVSALSDPNRKKGQVHDEQVNDELERFRLWMGNIGALNQPESSMSLESRLHKTKDVLDYVLRLLNDLNMFAKEFLEIVSREREEEIDSAAYDDGDDEEDEDEETELLKGVKAFITRLFRVSSLIRQAAPTDLFAKALSRTRYRFNDQFDIAHVGEKYPKLATERLMWLQKRLGRAITQRRHYLSYIQDHREKLEGISTHEKTPELLIPESQAPAEQLLPMKQLLDSSSRPSTFFTKASSLIPNHITPQKLAIEEDSDPENDARSYTTISRSVDGDLDLSTTVRIPKLNELQAGSKKEVECPFCFRIKKFKNEQMWRRHVFSDLRPYVCTFPDCDVPYFSDINEWFRHEMQSHRVSYTCRLCQCKTFQLRERYLAHVRKQHPDMLDDGEEQPVLDIARKPLGQIPAQECPCCSEWVDRLKERAEGVSIHSDASDHIIRVVPTVFKRHLASHLEQLALFAVPIGSTAKSVIDSDAAVKEDVGTMTGGPDFSALVFDSSRPSSPASKGHLSNDFPYTEEFGKAAVANVQGGDYSNELYTASTDGHEQLVKLLLERGADIHAQGRPYGNALQAASAKGHDPVVKLLLGKGADIHAQGGHYGNALNAASASGHTQVVKLLLDQGADFQAQSGDYGNALQAASTKGHEQVVKLLLDKGADVNAQGGTYGNALQAASFEGHDQVVKLLVDHGADVNAQGGVYGNALQAASVQGYGQVVKLLLDKGANVNAQGGHNRNALQAASFKGHEQVVKLLLDQGADVNAQGGDYGNALQAASLEGHEQVMKLLFDQGADVNAQGGIYGNALQAASAEGHEQVVKLLLDKGADVNAQGGHYGNALQAASFEGYEQVVKLLLENGADVNAQGGVYGNALQAASAKGHKQLVKLLVDHGADVNAQGGQYGNALLAASAEGHEQVVKLLLNQGVDVNAQGGHYGNALQAASAEGHEQVVKLLLNQGADVNAQGGHSGNALMAASAKGHEQVVKLLLETDQVDVSSENKDGQTPLLLATQNGHEDIVKLLQSHSNVS